MSIHIERSADGWRWTVVQHGLSVLGAGSHIVVACGWQPGIQEAEDAASTAASRHGRDLP